MHLRILAKGLLFLASGLTLLLTGCAGTGPAGDIAQRLDALLPADVLLLGEQHDASAHQALERATVEHLARQQRLAAVALEMAAAGTSTRGLPAGADEPAVRAALQWSDRAWPWQAYGPVVMAAVRAGVPVVGANLPTGQMREAMARTALDAALPGPALKAQQQRIREGHCGMLPESQIQPMTRVQIARDQQMAQTLAALAQPGSGRMVLLVAGAGHVDRALGVPLHLPPNLVAKVVQARTERTQAAMNSGAEQIAADAVWPTPALPPTDYCAAFKAPGSTPAPRPAPAAQ